MVSLEEFPEFLKAKEKEDISKLAYKIPGAVGFTMHPSFFGDCKYAHAVINYTELSSRSSSWALYLFDKEEA